MCLILFWQAVIYRSAEHFEAYLYAFFQGTSWNKAYSLLLSSEPFWCLVNALYVHKVVLLWLVWTWMIYNTLCVLGIVWFMAFLKLFFPGTCSLLEFMKFHPVDISSRGCFTDFWSSVLASLSFPALALKILVQSASLNSVLCLFSSKKLLDSLFPSQLCCLEIVSRQKARAFLGFPSFVFLLLVIEHSSLLTVIQCLKTVI